MKRSGRRDCALFGGKRTGPMMTTMRALVSSDRTLRLLIVWLCLICGRRDAAASEIVDHPFLGVTHITRTETAPRAVTMHIVRIDLTVPGIAFRLTPPGGTRESVRQTVLTYLNATQ